MEMVDLVVPPILQAVPEGDDQICWNHVEQDYWSTDPKCRSWRDLGILNGMRQVFLRLLTFGRRCSGVHIRSSKMLHDARMAGLVTRHRSTRR